MSDQSPDHSDHTAIDSDRLEAARMALSQAVARSCDARLPTDPDGRATETHVFAAELKLRQGGRPDLARRLEAQLTGDVTTTAARRELREVAQLLDAELDPTVTTAAFVVASDGGERR